MKTMTKILLAAALWLLLACTLFAGPQTRALLEAASSLPVAKAWSVPRTYAEARQQAIDRNLPLVVWSGKSL